MLLVSLLGDAGLLPQLPGGWPGEEDRSRVSAAGAAKHLGS